MTDSEANEILEACKDLVTRVNAAYPNKVPPNSIFTEADFQTIQRFDRLQGDPIAAGPGLLGHLEQAAGLGKAEIIRLEQLRRLIYNRRHFVGNNR